MDVSRRNVLAVSALGVAGVGLVGCSSGEDTTTTTESGQTAATGPSPASSGTALVATADVPVDSGIIVDAGQTKVVVTQPESGTFVGLSAVCPHQHCLVNSVEQQTITCPCHGSQFSTTDGSVLRGPATTGLTPVSVTVDGDQVVLG